MRCSKANKNKRKKGGYKEERKEGGRENTEMGQVSRKRR